MKIELDTRARIVIMMVLINLAILLPLVLVPLYHNNGAAAAIVYNVYGPTCHQYISRSLCFFRSDDGSWGMGDCIAENSHPTVETRFTMAKLNYSGPFFYSREEIGINRAEVVHYEGKTGYKMPACARDFGIYSGTLMGILLFLAIGKRFGVVSLPVYLAFLAPLAIDGASQMVFSYESSNMIRIATGLVAGAASTIALLSMMFNSE